MALVDSSLEIMNGRGGTKDNRDKTDRKWKLATFLTT